jgi:hypothetical protein
MAAGARLCFFVLAVLPFSTCRAINPRRAKGKEQRAKCEGQSARAKGKEQSAKVEANHGWQPVAPNNLSKEKAKRETRLALCSWPFALSSYGLPPMVTCRCKAIAS